MDASNSGTTFAIEDEDHTLANTLRFFLNKNPNVALAGYSMPHPSEELVNLRVQTIGDVTPSQALRSACEDIKQVCSHIDSVFDQQLAQFRSKGRSAGTSKQR